MAGFYVVSLLLLLPRALHLSDAVVKSACAGGRLSLLIGTQALLDPVLLPADLRLVVVDEQHRFGVA